MAFHQYPMDQQICSLKMQSCKYNITPNKNIILVFFYNIYTTFEFLKPPDFKTTIFKMRICIFMQLTSKVVQPIWPKPR